MGYVNTNQLGAVINSVRIQRNELEAAIKKYELISDATAGEFEVKAKGADYLPIPSSCTTYSTTDPRYVAYQTRAVYYNVTQPTRDALVGQIFLRPPMIDVPTQLEPMLLDTNGEGLTMEQLIRKAANYVLPYGRGGLLTDFPSTDGEVTVGQAKSGKIRPIIKFYEPWSIRNWRIEKGSTEHKLVMLVLDENYETVGSDDNEFDVQNELRHRVYRLDEKGCSVQIYEEDNLSEPFYIFGADGKPLQQIPFEFVGSENNDADVDDPPFYNLANLNIAHFRNSADYEESAFLVGQPTPVYSGLTEDWVNNYFAGGIPFGSRASVPLPEGATAQLLQAEPNTLVYEAMRHKEEQMISIGAKILNPSRSTVEKKQVEVEIEAASQRSTLTTIVDNLELAMIASLERAATFMNVSPGSVKIQLNRNFDLTSAQPEEIRWLLELWKENAIGFSELRENLRRNGMANPTAKDEEIKAEIMSDQPLKKLNEPTPTQSTGSNDGPQNQN